MPVLSFIVKYKKKSISFPCSNKQESLSLTHDQRCNEVRHDDGTERCGGGCGPAWQHSGLAERTQYFDHAPHQWARSFTSEARPAVALGHATGDSAYRFPRP